MRPGEEASGSVTITNTGTVTGALTLAPAAPADTPGPGGGTLSNKLELLVIDVTTGVGARDGLRRHARADGSN